MQEIYRFCKEVFASFNKLISFSVKLKEILKHNADTLKQMISFNKDISF